MTEMTGAEREGLAGELWEEAVAGAHDRLLADVADDQARRKAGLFSRDMVSAFRLRAQEDGTVYAQHECGCRIYFPLNRAHDALAELTAAAAVHVCSL